MEGLSFQTILSKSQLENHFICKAKDISDFWYFGLDILFIEWQDGSKREKMRLVEFSDLEPAVGSQVKEYVEAAVKRVFIFFLL